MATVPYSSVPQVGLQDIATPEMNPKIPAAAFGGEAAQALSGFGKVAEHAGDEIFQRAIALQNLDNEAQAKQAASDYQIKAGELHANYSSLQGKAAVDGFKKYTTDLSALRHQMRDGLGTAMSQKMFDSDSLSTMGRTIFNGAGHAATENKKYIAGASAARIETASDAAFSDTSDAALENGKKVIETEVRGTQAHLAGWSQEKTDEVVKQNQSALISKRILGTARTDPFKAAKMLEDNKATLTPDDFLKADNTVRAQSRAVGSVNIANDIYTAGKGDDEHPAKPLSVMEAEAREAAKARDPNDPLLETHTIAALRGQYNQDLYAKKQEYWNNEQTIAGAIGKGVKNEQELRADPTVAAAIDALPKDKRLNIPARINSYNAARDKVANQEEFNTRMGLANNDVEGFLSFDPYSSKSLNQAQMNQIAAKQAKLKQSQAQDPRVDRAMGWMRGAVGAQMEALGVFKRTTSNKDDYDHLTGTVQSALDLWQESHNKPPTNKEFIEQIAPQVLQQRNEPGILWGTNKKPFFTQTIPNEFSEKTKADVVAKGGLEPTDEQIYKAYVRTQLMKLYPTKMKSSE